MTNERLERERIFIKREIKIKQSILKQIEDELERRFDNGTLVEGKEEEK